MLFRNGGYFNLYLKKKTFFWVVVLFLNLISRHLSGQVIQLTEIMFAPSASNSEFIELYNTSNLDTLDLTNFKIQYHTSTADEIISTTNSYKLLPNQYAVIFEADYDFENGIYKTILPANSAIFVLDDNAFGSTGMANTSDRTVSLLNSESDTIISITYSADNEVGYSDELVDFTSKSWQNSLIENGTPGFKNSVSPKEYDLSLSEFYFLKDNIIVGETAQLRIKISNLGTKPASQFTLNIYNDVNNDNIQELSELIITKQFAELAFDQFLVLEESITNISFGQNNFIAEIIFENDELVANNKSKASIYGAEINEVRGDLTINEIMYAPTSPEPEWIELFNKSEKIIDFSNYKIADKNDTVSINKQQVIIQPNQYLVVADDTTIYDNYPDLKNVIFVSIPTLNNTDDEIVIMDSLFRIIDSVSYSSSWGGNSGNSLERIDPFASSTDPENWSESNFPTPGKINSIAKKEKDIKIDSVFFTPNNAVIGDSVTFTSLIKNIGKNEADFVIELFDDTNNDSVADNIIEKSKPLFLNSADSLLFTFSTKIRIEEQSKNYLIILAVADDDSTNNSFWFSVKPGYHEESILVNEIMFSPSNDEPEWIELYNNSAYSINLNNWEVGDVLTNPVYNIITNEDFTINPNQYLVITKDESIFNYHKLILSPVVKTKFANLNNDSDGIVIKDNRGITIDSVLYTSDWGVKGNSIERINKNFSSTNKNNWGASIDLEGSTPGRVNSISPKDIDVAITQIYSFPINPVKNDEIKINVKVKNYGKLYAEGISIKFYYGSNFADTFLEETTNASLNSGDSLILSSSKSIIIVDTLMIAAQIKIDQDEDIVNNYLETQLVSGFNKNTLLISEVMFKTENNNPEWVELYNNTDSTINLKNWLVSNGSISSIITQEDRFIEPTKHSILSSYASENYFEADTNIIFTELPILNDKKGSVIIYDFRNALIDSMLYNVPGTIKPNISLERISYTNSSVDETNWIFSLSSKGSTPGEPNSIFSLPNINFGEAIFTEIMFDPKEGNSEYLEIYNSSTQPIEIGGWKIKVGEEMFRITDESFLIEHDNYFIIAADSSVLENYNWLLDNHNVKILDISSLGLTNTGKMIYLIDYKNNVVDSLDYSDKWHNSAFAETKNISLELINVNLDRSKSRNWSSSVSSFGGSPGKQNSIFIDKEISKSKLHISPNPFSPDNDGFEDFTIISYDLKEPISQIRIRIYDSKGRQIRTLANNISSGSKGEIIFDGLDENGKPLKIGIYIILFEAANTNSAVLERLKEVVVIARKF